MKQKPIASAKRGTKTVTLNGIEVFGRKYSSYHEDVNENSTYTSHVTSGADNWKPTQKPVIIVKGNKKVMHHSLLAERLVERVGTNENYCDTLKSPFKN